MRRLMQILLLWSTSVAWAQSSMAARSQDLDWVANQLPKLHANFFFQLDPAAYQQAVGNLQANLAGMTTAEFYVALAKFLK